MTTTQPKGWSGLDARQIVHQSTMIHPDWDPKMHAWFLAEEEGINLEHLRPNPGEAGPLETIARWAEEVS
jgi:hypothetical protein